MGMKIVGMGAAIAKWTQDGSVSIRKGHQAAPPSASQMGAVEVAESCEDGNEEAGDGCQVEEGWSCTLTKELASICEKDERCGNGRLDPPNLEECDDGNLAVGGGCDEACRI